MKKVLLTVLLLLNLSVYSQEKWRTLTFGTTLNFKQHNNSITQLNASLDYELNNSFFISSWNGLSFNPNNKTSWFASQTTLDKRIKGFTFGVGYLYTTNSTIGSYIPINIMDKKDELYFTIKLQYRIKL